MQLNADSLIASENAVSFGQEALWVQHQLHPDSAAYNNIFAWEVPKELDTSALSQAITVLIARHELLRSFYDTNQDGRLCRKTLAPAPACIDEIELIDDLNADPKELIYSHLQRPFKLTSESPVRWILFKKKCIPFLFVIVQHHIIMDLWTIMILVRDLEDAYSALINGKAPVFQPLNNNYSNYIEEQVQLVRSEKGQKLETYWRSKLAGMPQSLEIPTDFPRPPVKTSNKDCLHFAPPSNNLNAFQSIGNSISFPLISQYETLFHILLSRYSGQSDIAVGIPTAGRNDRYDGIYGYFTNAVIVRNTIDYNASYRDQLIRQHESITAALNAKDYPFALLTSILPKEHSSSNATIIQACFNWENANRFCKRDQQKVFPYKSNQQLWKLGALGNWIRLPIVQQFDDFELTLKICKYRDQLTFSIEYNIDLFTRTTIERMAEHYCTLMESAAENPDAPISTLNLLPAQEQKKILYDWNQTHTNYDRDSSIVQQFEALVSNHPENTAINFCARKLTYAEFDRQANRIAHLLLNLGVSKEATVGVLLERCPEIVISFIGILKAGACYLPLDPDYPKDRLAFIAQDAKPTIILTCSKLRSKTSEISPSATIIEWDSDELFTASTATPNINIRPNQLAYIIYTSGSTGIPKGVMVEHRNLTHLAESQYAKFGKNHVKNVLQFASVNFDASIFEFLMALLQGATLHMAHRHKLIGSTLSDFLRENNIDWALLPPTLLACIDTGNLPDLNTLVVGGEACSTHLAQRWSKGRKLLNAYGPTEYSVWATTTPIDGTRTPPIGRPISNTKIYILDQQLNPTPQGISGEIHIGGEGLARGYLNRPELTAEKFIINPFSNDASARIYKTGDLGRYLTDGSIDFLGRIDQQVKIRGFRIEPGEIESLIRKHPSVMDALVIAKDNIAGRVATEKLLIAYIVKHPRQIDDTKGLRAFLRNHLPEYMIPSAFVWLNAFPMTHNEKIDRRALPEPCFDDNPNSEPIQLPATEIERQLAEAWKTCLGLKQVSTRANFFDLGGHSLLLSKMYASLPAALRDAITMVDLYKYPTIQMLAQHAGSHQHPSIPSECARNLELPSGSQTHSTDIAIIGMAGRFPGANSVDAFWQNICDGKESIKLYTHEELRAAGVDESLIHHPNFVPAKGTLDDIAGFDATFFNFTPREAQITDPQQRLFLETAWHALEDAGCDPNRFVGRIGIYAGSGFNHYLMQHVMPHSALVAMVGDYTVMLGNHADFLCSRVAYKLNLRGPAVVVQTACSTSLVAVHHACQALLARECDAALAGGVSLGVLDSTGYLFKEGMILSPDGHCRAFDAEAAGTVQGQGCGIVVLKRLDDALASRDHIYAVISGSAINNDGAQKPGFTAPSIAGQLDVIQRAQAVARISPTQIGYVETHGTGTPIGDPIEFTALSEAFNKQSTNINAIDKTCAIGSVKTNIGHLDTAAGVAGLIKAAKALEQRKLPPSLHFTRPNPQLNFNAAPFYVNTCLQEWPAVDDIRHAAVSSFGMGGTNAHVVLREPPALNKTSHSRLTHLVTLSAQSMTALNTLSAQLATHLAQRTDQTLADTCYTLHTGRAQFSRRRFLVCTDRTHTIELLTSPNASEGVAVANSEAPAQVVFLFSGQGSQYINMGRELYRTEATYKTVIDQCCQYLIARFPDVYGNLGWPDAFATNDTLHQTYVTQPSLFIFEYALAQLLKRWGITPQVMLGHSIGEYVAACLAGVFTLEQALELVALRGILIQELPPGCMLSVRLSEVETACLVNEQVSLAAVNSEQRCVLAGSQDVMQNLHESLKKQGVESRIEKTSHAFHSHMLQPVLERFASHVARLKPQAPHIRYVSSLTGEFVTREQVCSPDYWAEHMRGTMRFNSGVNTILNQRSNTQEETTLIFLEVGPGKSLTTLARQNSHKHLRDVMVATTRHANEEGAEIAHLLRSVGHLWANGVAIDWDAFHSDEPRQKVPLPSYPFKRSSYWVPAKSVSCSMKSVDLADLPPLPAAEEEPATASTLIMPRDAMEEALFELWKVCLGRSDFGVEDNFFDLGGDSLLSVGLVDRLRSLYSISLPTQHLMQHPTIAKLASHIQLLKSAQHLDHNASIRGLNDFPLITLQRGGASQLPLILVHPIGGEVFFYHDLAQNLGAEQPVYAFQAPSLSGGEPPINSVYSMAERYLSILKDRGFMPPYLLGGSSFGGLVAYEMAQQLKRYGEEVRLVVMIDTPAPSQMPRNLTDSAAILQYLLQGKLSLSLEKLRTLSQQAQIDYVLEEARLQGRGNALPPHLGIPLFSTWIAHQEATFAYSPEPYHDDVVFFQHTEPMENFPPDPSNAWKELVEGALTVHHVAGNHISMNYPPHVKTLANHLKHILRGYLGG